MIEIEKIYITWMIGFILWGFGMTFENKYLVIGGTIVLTYLFGSIIYKEYKRKKVIK